VDVPDAKTDWYIVYADSKFRIGIPMRILFDFEMRVAAINYFRHTLPPEADCIFQEDFEDFAVLAAEASRRIFTGLLEDQKARGVKPELLKEIEHVWYGYNNPYWPWKKARSFDAVIGGTEN
jgi:hypothetical protein